MNNLKSNKGITLVALIITIIVLLILTVVAIRTITGEGVLDKAKTATNSYEDKRKQEENMLGNYADIIDANMPQNTITGETQVTGKAYVEGGYLLIITSDNRCILYQNDQLGGNFPITDIQDLSNYVTDKNLQLSRFFATDIGYFAVSSNEENNLYLLEIFKDDEENIERIGIVQTFVLNETIDVSQYLN